MDKISQEQKEQALIDYEMRLNKRISVGKTIIIAIAILEILSSIFSAIANANIFTLIISVIISVALLSGKTWARYLFAAGMVINVIFISYVLIENNAAPSFNALPSVTVIILLINLVYAISCTVLLFTSKSVSEYMYSKVN